MLRRARPVLAALLALPACSGSGWHAGPAATLAAGATATFAILETTDLHATVRSYDYFKLAEDRSIGLERTATLIRQARAELPDSLLVDDGDTILGTALADHQATASPVPCARALAIHAAMNALGYEVGTIGNHDFDQGLAYLAQVTHTAFDVEGLDARAAAGCQGPRFPLVLSNVFSTRTGRPLFPAEALVAKTISARTPDGQTVRVTLKIGLLAFTPPPIVRWDRRRLGGKIFTRGVREVAGPLVEALRARGADLIVALIHGGLDDTAYTPELENQALYLAQVPGIDVMLMGHAHQVFPDPASALRAFNLEQVDKTAGTVAGVPSVMASFWGQHLGVIRLGLVHDGRAWTVDRVRTLVEARPIATTCAGGAALACQPGGTWRTGGPCAFATACAGQPDRARVFVDPDPSIAPLVEAEHQATLADMATPIGTTDFEMSTFFAEAGDVTALQIVNQALADHVAAYVHQNLPEYASLPVLAVSAPFRFGAQGGGDYTDVGPGPLAMRAAADLYLFANTVQAVKVTGAELEAWLETAANRFAQIDPARTDDQQLINRAVPGFDFDVITDPDIAYEIDVTRPRPARGARANGRIKGLTYKGRPIDPQAQLIVATNSYRASGGGRFPGLDGGKTIYASQATNREVLIAYLRKVGSLTRARNGSARSWHFARVKTAGRVLFTSAANALDKARAVGLGNVTLVQADDGSDRGLSVYAIDLGR